MRTLFPIVMFLLPFAGKASPAEPIRITVIDSGNSWPVPLVELRTTSGLKFVTDNAGVVAFDAPEFMGQETWLSVSSPGYFVPKDGFGFEGVKVTPKAGGKITIKVNRTSVAKRVGRITGSGLFAESQKLGQELDWKESGITGCDTVQMAAFGKNRFWLWGDTNVPQYPLGIYHTSAATSLQPFAQLQPPLKPQFEYFRNAKQQVRAVALLPGKGPTWLFGLIELKDKTGTAKLVAQYLKIEGHLTVYEWGLCGWNEKTQNFEVLKTVWKKADNPREPPIPHGHAVIDKDQDGKDWLLQGNPFPTMKCPADYESWLDFNNWQNVNVTKELKSADGKTVIPHSGSLGWHETRKRWVTVFMEKNGKPSTLGEVWYTEAESPFGPWQPPIKLLSHPNYTFYNPRVLPELTPKGSNILLFEGTYTAEFANKPEPTPRYNYNQILYRLDLEEEPFRKK